VLNFTAIDLQLYKIFKITQVSFSGTQCTRSSSSSRTIILLLRYKADPQLRTLGIMAHFHVFHGLLFNSRHNRGVINRLRPSPVDNTHRCSLLTALWPLCFRDMNTKRTTDGRRSDRRLQLPLRWTSNKQLG